MTGGACRRWKLTAVAGVLLGGLLAPASTKAFFPPIFPQPSLPPIQTPPPVVVPPIVEEPPPTIPPPPGVEPGGEPEPEPEPPPTIPPPVATSPEPATIVMGLIGLGVLSGWSLKRHRQPDRKCV